jgi:hypothetical protein
VTQGPICSTLANAVGLQGCALRCMQLLAQQREIGAEQHRRVRSWQGLYLADAHVLLCLVASSSPSSNEARYGESARSTPR